MNRFPDFFIVGAPKCGTTSLYRYLETHRQIYMPDRKEPDYYCADLSSIRKMDTPEKYLELFKSAEPQSMWGEASPWYLYSKEAASAVLQDNPRAKFIVCLRRPVDMFLSYHSQMILNLVETELAPEQAWRLQCSRKAAAADTLYTTFSFQLMYSDVCMLGEQTKRLVETVPSQQLRFILFDDLAQNPRKVYTDVLAYLGLPDGERRDFPKYNPRRSHKYPKLTEFMKKPPPPFSYLKAGLKAVLPSPRRFSERVYDSLTQNAKPPTISQGFRDELQHHFADDIDLLAQVTGFDLSEWR